MCIFACLTTTAIVLASGLIASEDLRLSAEGFGPVRFGMHVDAAASALGVTLERLEATHDGESYVVYPPRSLARISFTVSALGLVDGASVHFDARDIKTDRGINIGSSPHDVWEAYKGKVEVKAFQCANAFLTFTHRSPADPSMGIVYTVSGDGLVQGVVAGRVDEIPPPC